MVLVPTVDAARQLRRAIGDRPGPAVVTREQFYDELHRRMDVPPPRLSVYDRDVMIQSAGREASTRDTARLRPGLMAEVLKFYDQLRRQARNLDRFEELLTDALSKDAEHDRGAERMLAQARWLVATFRGYERRVRQSEACDEHVLRERLISSASANPIREIVVTLGDWIADPDGLYLADFDLLTRLPGVEAVDLVATASLLESGFHQRAHEWLPGIEEVDAVDLGAGSFRPARPTLAVPDPDRTAFLFRDREEELIAVARRLATDAVPHESLDRVAVVFKRPLPYLYLAREVFGNARLPYQGFDALPLAAEPFPAALDLLFEFIESTFTRSSLVALLRSPHFAFRFEDQPLKAEAIDALDRALSAKRYLGTLDALLGFDAGGQPGQKVELPALRAAQDAASALSPLLTAGAASVQLRCLLDFIDAHDPLADDAATGPSRLRRQRTVVRDALAALAAAHAAHDETPMGIADVATSVRRWIEEQTFAADSPHAGVHLLDDQAARYGEFDDVTLVGLIEGEWPERPRRNIFFPSSLLISLGWPTEKDRRGAAEARFIELLQSSTVTVAVSTVSLDDEALVEPSMFIEEIPRAQLTVDTRVTPSSVAEWEEARAGTAAPAWLAMRSGRTASDAPEFHGQTGPLEPRTWSVSALETYLDCPFKFFAKHVLRLDEEPDDEEVMDPRRRGLFVHAVFEAFFARWQDDGNQTVTPDTIASARTLFHQVVEDLLAKSGLSETEAALERTRLVGSAAAAGLGEAVLRMEAERPVPVVARLLEHRLAGEFTLQTTGGARRLPISGKADRIDLLADGTFRLIDYKLGWPPNKARALQLPIYAVCAEQGLKELGRRWTLGEAAYLAFKGPRRVVSLFGSDEERTRVVAEAQQRLVDTVDAIGAGRFPPTPDDVYRCETCSYSVVCRKDYVGDV